MVLEKDGEDKLNDRVRKEELLKKVKEERNVLQTIKWREANWLGHILRRNYCLKHIIEKKIERKIHVTWRRRRRCMKPLDGVKEKTGYCRLEEESMDRQPWRIRVGRGYGSVIRLTTEWMNEYWSDSNQNSRFSHWRYRPTNGKLNQFAWTQFRLEKLTGPRLNIQLPANLVTRRFY